MYVYTNYSPLKRATKRNSDATRSDIKTKGMIKVTVSNPTSDPIKSTKVHIAPTIVMRKRGL
jgi:hypothetical protein